MKVRWKVQRYLIDVSSLSLIAGGVIVNGASVIEFGAHVVVVGSLWLGELWTVWVPELGH